MRKLVYLIKRARGRPLGFLAARLMDIPRSKLRWVLDVVGRSPYSSSYIRKFSPEWSGFSGEFFFQEDDIAQLTEISKTRTNWGAIVSTADMILQGKFAMLGRELYWDQGIGWQEDPTAGFKWPYKFHALYRYSELVDTDRDADIKIPWEMSRLQFLPVLAMSYRLTGNTKYVSKLHGLLGDWHHNNPVGWGIGWVCTMDVSLRAIALVWVIHLMAGTSWLEHNALWLRTILSEHGRFIYRNVEYSDINGNHHTACLLGLLYLGLLLRNEPEAAKWLTRAVQGLQKEIMLQTYEDGVCHEGSIPYHGLVTEMFLHAGLLCRRNHITLESWYWQRLERMLDFTQAYTKPNGKAPLFGDNDSGRVVSFGGLEVNDHRYLLAVGSVLFHRADMKVVAGLLSADALWLMGIEGVTKYDAIESVPERRESVAFSRGGYWILRNDLGDYVMIDCGDIGLRGRGGHGHFDTLSIETHLAGHDNIVDTGCFTYSAFKECRRGTISAKAHNAVIIDATEPAAIMECGILGVSSYDSTAIDWTISTEQCSFTGEHFGYRRLPGQVRYRRTVSLDSSNHQITISESVNGGGIHHLSWRFHLAPKWSIPLLCSHKMRVVVASEDSEAVCLVETNDRSIEVGLERSEYYPSYGVSENSWTITFHKEVELPYLVEFTIIVS
jgi:hypothetical protein